MRENRKRKALVALSLFYFLIFVPAVIYAMGLRLLFDQYFFALLIPLFAAAWYFPRRYYLLAVFEFILLGLWLRIALEHPWKNTVLLYTGSLPAIIFIAEMFHYFGRRQREARTALKASEDRYKNLVDALDDVVWSIDGAANFTFVSSGIEKMAGFRPGELIGQPVFKVLPEESSRIFRELFANPPAGERLRIELMQRRKDGTQYLGEVRAFWRTDDQGQITYAQGITRDITHQKETEEALRNSQRERDSILFSVPDMIYRLDTAGRFTFINESVRRYGYSPDEMLGRELLEFVHPEDRGKAGHAIRERRTGDRRMEALEIRLINAAGNYGHFEILSEGYYADDFKSGEGEKAFIGTQGIAHDITARKAAEGKLRYSEETAMVMLNATSDLAFLMDDKGNILRLNEKFAERFNTVPEKLAGKNVLDLLPPANAAIRRSYAEKVLETGEPVRFEDVREGVWLEICIYPAFSDGSHIKQLAVFSRDITEEKRAAENLKKSEERYRRITRAITDYIYTVHLENGSPVSTEHSPACEAVTGYTAAEFHEDPMLWMKMVPEPDRARVREQARRILENGEAMAIRHRIRRKDGVLRTITNTPVLHYDAAGRLRGWDGLIQDITDQAAAEDALARRDAILQAVNLVSESFLRKRDWKENAQDLLRKMGEAADVSRCYIFENHPGTGEQVLTSCRYEWTAPGIMPQIDSPDLQNYDLAAGGYQRWIDTFRERGIVFGHVRDFPAKEQPILLAQEILSLLIVPVFVGDEWWGFIGFDACREARAWPPAEIDALKTAAGTLSAAIERSRAGAEHQRMAAAVQQAAEAIMITDCGGVIEYVNPAFESLTGYKAREVRGRKPSILKSGRHDEAFYRNLWQTILRGEVWSGRIHNQCKDGRIIEEERTISPLRDAHGELTSFVALGRDVTNEMNLERQLRQAQKMEALGTLAGGIAHDFNNILSLILGHCEIVLNATAPENPHRKNIQLIRKAGARASELVRQILTFSRKQEPQLKPLWIRAVLNEAIPLIRSSFPATVTLEEDIRRDCGYVMADPTQMHQVILNLCTNALQAMREDGGRLGIALYPCTLPPGFMPDAGKPEGEEYVCLRVSDSGEGIPRENLQRIFDPFFSTRHADGGTGLGLSTVHGIVLACNGMIRVQSEADTGSAFEVYLPRISMDDPEEDGGGQELQRGSGRIMLIDDDEEITEIVGLILESLGYSVSRFSRGITALKAFQEAPDTYDAVITDYIMPVITGVQIAAEIHKTLPEIPVILMTGYSEGITPQKAREYGICEYLEKPVNTGTLSRALRNALGGSSGGNKPPA
jgi:PAS domain S-box-containing protein